MTDRETVSRGNVTLSTLATGRRDGPAVLLSNSLGAGLGMWNAQRKMLEPHYCIIGYDTRGHGESSTPEGAYSLDELVADAIAVLDHYDVEQADFIGLSLGGMTGLGLGLDHADRMNKIVCACARADNPPPFIASWDDRIAAIAQGGLGPLWSGTLDRWLTARYIADNPDDIAALRADFLVTTDGGYSGCAAALKSLNYLPRLHDMTVPVLFVSGANDMGAPSDTMRAMSVTTPNSRHEDIPDCAHIANINQQQAFNHALTQFLGV